MGAHITKKRSLLPLYDACRDRGQLWDAWAVVRRNALQSQAAATRNSSRLFEDQSRRNIERIARQLHRQAFKFAKQKGVLVTKSNGSKRPLVVAPVESRIVQRSILETLQRVPSVASRLTAGYNFGGVPGQGLGVPGAVLKVLKTAQSHPHFIRTDIKSFFMRVPKKKALDALLDGIAEEPFNELVRSAVTTELEHAEGYGPDVSMFPLHDEGVAQGSCLSPLLCNLLLHDFDKEMNSRGIVTVRYIDDFITMAGSERAASKAFDAGRAILRDLGLDCYDPRNLADAEKAECGHFSAGADFLGCTITPTRVRPSRANWKDLLQSIKTIFSDALRDAKNPVHAIARHTTHAETLVRVGETIRGCTDDQLLRNIDTEIDDLLFEYESAYRAMALRMSQRDRRRAVGVFLAQDRKLSETHSAALALTAEATQPSRGRR
jgi:retron-type reverse transcriptase